MTAIKLPLSKQNSSIGLCKLTTPIKTVKVIRNGMDSVKISWQFLIIPNRLQYLFLVLLFLRKISAPICFISHQHLADLSIGCNCLHNLTSILLIFRYQDENTYVLKLFNQIILYILLQLIYENDL